MEMIKDRGENIKNEDLYYATVEAKEKYGYLCKDIAEEFSEWDKKDFDEVNQKKVLSSKFKKLKGIGKIS